MKHWSFRVTSASACVLALALADAASAQTLETSTSSAATKTATVAAGTTKTSTASATTVTRKQAPKRQRRKISARVEDYRNPQGSVLSAFFLGVGYDSDSGSTVVAFGLGFGYAVLTGVVPGARAELIYDDGFSGQVAGTLTLTPPLTWSLTPFVLGEVGLHFEPDRRGTLYGVGTGFFLGDPVSHLAIQLGWVWRKIDFSEGPDKDGSGPLLAINYRF